MANPEALEDGAQRTEVKDWDGPDDQGNPRNWSPQKKFYHCAIPTAIAFLCPFGSSVYTPGISQVETEFHVTREIALLPFVSYLLGLSFGPIVAGPSSETFGRKAVYICALPGVAAFTLGAGFSQNITSLIVCRFFAGLFASPGLSIGTAMVSDFLPLEKRGGPVAVFITMVQMGPVFGPIIGGYVTESKNWRWTQWVILFGIVFAFALTAPMSESYKAVLLKRRAKKLGIEPPPEFNTSALQSLKYFVTKTVSRPIQMMFTEPIVGLFDIYNAFNFGLLNAFFAAFSWVFENVYGFGIGSTGLTYIGQAVGSIMGLLIVLYIYNSYWAKESKKAKEGNSSANMAPEKRLIIAKIGAPMFPVS
ncbi:uncharacterized protein LTR77_001821 [Saxophila tyrrhenica]|uniref:Major facilitator superfamily (MFS) profile domain-containing protein n=1 Tax=Saxophila tyrrhenica TaxID=1690608 RepID=A0AAV9PR23_9PEZI|nr:hypothetical protein LTR77_001821 [Saxophila tyrrhenica]